MVLKLAWAQKQMFWVFIKWYFSDFLQFFSEKVETIFWESEAKHQKLFKSIGHRKLFRKRFLRYLELKNECSECLKRAFSVFCKSLSVEVETIFWESQAKPFQFNFGCHRKIFWKSFGVTLRSKTNVHSISRGKFSVFCNFWVTKLKQFLGK